MLGLSFKKEKKETGLASVSSGIPATQIKYYKKEVGAIIAPNWLISEKQWRIRLAINQSSERCGWRWITLQQKHDSEEQAREWLKQKWKTITKKWELHQFDY